MRIRIERLRVWLLASAGLLVVVVAGFIGTARYLRRYLFGAVAQKLGANVKVDTSGITWSHTNGTQTDYVVHAGREVEHADGKVALHDVWIKLCGQQQKRADMVRGDEWEWDKKAGVIRALGAVHIELRDTGGKPGCAAVDDSAAAEVAGRKTMRATTSDLIYMQKLGVAATSAPIEFESGKMRGHAVGADYASDSGTLMLHSAVSLAGISAGQAIEIEAAAAELDGQERVARLTNAKYTSGSGAGARTATAEQAVLHLRADQTLERIEAQGNVTMQAGGGTVSSAKADVTMDVAGHPVNALLAGGMKYSAAGPLAERRGEAEQAAITFDGNASPQVQRAVFTGAVHFVERSKSDAAKSAWNTRELTAGKLDVALAPGADGKNEARDAEATGGARFSEVNAGKAAGAGVAATAPVTTEIAADDLKTHFGAASGGKGSHAPLETASGRGHTLVRQVTAAGVEQTSTGDMLDARFRQAGSAKKTGSATDASLSADELVSAVQAGHVAVTREDPEKKNGGDDEVRATAQQANYDGDTGRVTLTGGVQLTDVVSQLWASRVVLEHATGNAQAFGRVKVEYDETSTETNSVRSKGHSNVEPIHVLAEQAELNHATDTVTFHGTPVRMWHGGSQILAPVIEMQQTAKRLRLIASGEGAAGTGTAQVHTVLMSSDEGSVSAGQSTTSAGAAQPCVANAGAGKLGAPPRSGGQQVFRIASAGLVYSQALDEAEFSGGFRVETSDAGGETVIRANAGTVYLKESKAAGGAQSSVAVPSLEGSVDHIVANGQVAVDRPGLRASGGRLLYTANDQDLLLTGDAKSSPKALDARGNISTGAALEFRRACGGTGGDTVEVLNKVPGGPGSMTGVHTEVQADAKRKRGVQ